MASLKTDKVPQVNGEEPPVDDVPNTEKTATMPTTSTEEVSTPDPGNFYSYLIPNLIMGNLNTYLN